MTPEEAFSAMLALTDLATPHAVRAAVGLGLPKLVMEGVDSIEALAERSGSRPRAMRSLVAYLTANGVFDEAAPGRVTLTPVGRVLASDRATLNLDPREAANHLALAWPGLMEAMRGGSGGYRSVFGRSLWDSIGADPALAAAGGRHAEVQGTDRAAVARRARARPARLNATSSRRAGSRRAARRNC